MKKILFSLFMLCGMTAAWSQDDGFVEVGTTKQLWDAIQANNSAKVRLTADFALSDIDKDGETYCNTFYGIIDGNGHTIKGDPIAPVRARTYMFSNCSGATIKNLTFKGIRVNSQSYPNQAIITSKAQNGCVFENITFDNVHTFSNKDNAGSAAGWAQDCTFTNITVRNSDFTTDANQSGCVVAHAIRCTFSDIRVENCESTSDDGKSGGVVGRADDCIFYDIQVLGTFIKTNSIYGGGVAGYSQNTKFTNCTVDDQSCICVDGNGSEAYAGGIVGWASNYTVINNCINSALVAGDNDYAGGIVGYNANSNVVGCLNTGMVIAITMADVKNGFYNKYKSKTGMTCVTKTYQGKEYVIRKYEGIPKSIDYYGGITGCMKFQANVSKCANLGSVYSGRNQGEDDHFFSCKTVGGIAGTLFDGTIRDCLSDFFGGMDVSGICQVDRTKYPTVQDEASVNNCLNLTAFRDISAASNEWKDFSGGNNYSLTTATGAHHTTVTIPYELKSGKICHLLGKNWEQEFGIDTHPTPGSRGHYHARSVSNEYGTACMPYALKSDDAISYYTLKEYLEPNGEITISFKYAERVAPGTPVLFKVAETGDIAIRDANDGWADSPVEVNPVRGTSGAWKFKGTFDYLEFQGQYSAGNIYYVSDGAIKHSNKITVVPYRSYFIGPYFDKLTGNGAKAIQIDIDDEDGETTALELVGEDLVPVQHTGKAYSIMGTEVGAGYRGIVIKNGKKLLRK